MTFTVSLTSAATETVTVDYATADLPNNAVAGVDYLATSGTLTFAPGETTKTVTVSLIGDTLEEFTEQVYLNLSNAVGAPENSLASEITWEWTSSPRTISQSPVSPLSKVMMRG